MLLAGHVKPPSCIMRATCTLLLRQLSLLLLLLLLEPSAGSGPFASSSDPRARTQLSGATTPAAGPQGSSSRGVSAAAAAAAAAASRLPPWERESSVPWAPPVSGSTSEPAAGGHTSSPVIGSSYQTLRSSDIEMRTSRSPTDNMETLTTFSRSGERTLLSVTNSAMSTTATESTTSYTEMISSADLTQQSSSVEQNRRNSSSSDMYFTKPGTEPLIVHSSEIPTYSSSQSDPPAIGSSHETASIWDTEKKTPSSHTDSMYISPTFRRGGERTIQLLTNSITSTDSLKSTTSHTEIAMSSDLSHSSASISWTGGSNRSSTIAALPESSTGPLLIYSPLKSGLPAIESSHQPTNGSEKNIASSHIASTYISTTSTRAGAGMLQDLINSSRSSNATGNSTSGTEMSSSSYLTQSSSISSIALTSGIHISLAATEFTEPSTDPLLTQSHSASETVSKAIGSSHQPINISATEKRTSDLYTTSTYSSTSFTRGGERTLRSLMNNSTLPDVADSSTSDLENTKSSDLPQPSSPVAQVGGSNISSSDLTEPSTESLFTHSSKIPSYSSSPNDLAAIVSSNQPVSISATEKRTSDLHTTTTYISTTLLKGGERTLRSLTNGNVSPDAAESSTSNLENTKASDLTQASTSVTQGGGSNISSTDFTDPSTEALLTHSSKSSSYSSSPNDLAAIGSSHQPVNISTTETRTSDVHTSSTYISVTFTGASGRSLTSLTNSSTLPDAAESSTSNLGNINSSDLPQPSSAVAQAGGNNISSSDFTEPSTEPLLTDSSKITSYSSSPNDLAAIGSSHQPVNISTTETRTSDVHTSSTYISVTFTGASERSLTSLTNSSTLPDAAESSTSNLGNINSSDLPQSSSAVAQAGGNNISSSDFTEPSTEPLLTHSSKIPSYSSSPNDLAAMESSPQPISISATEKRTSDLQTTSSYISTTFTRGGEKTFRSLTNSGTSPDATESSTSNLENTQSSDLPQPSSPVVESGGSNISSSDFTEPSTEPLLTHSPKDPTPSSSSNDLAGVGSSHQSVTISDREKEISSSPTHSTYVSTTFARGGERTSQSQTHSSTSTAATEISTHNIDAAESSDSTQFLSSVSQAGGFNISSSDADFMEPSTEPLLTDSSKSSTLSLPNDTTSVGSNHQSLSSSNTEKSPYTDSMYSSATLTGGGERTSQSLTNSTSTHTTESSTSYTEIANSSELILSPSMAETRGTSMSANDMDFTGSSTETFFIRSSKIPTDSSFQNDPSSIASSHQPVSSIDTEKRTSVSRTDSMYIQTTFSRGGDRTLLSISNNSTSAESSESSTFYAEISNSSDLAQSSSFMAQSRGSNVSSTDGDLIAPSTEPLLVHSSKMPTYSSTVIVQNATLFFTGTESSPTGSSSLSSSVFPSSSSVSSLHHLLSSTPSPPHSFASSESSPPSSSSVIPSSSLPPPSLSSSLSTSSSVESFPLLPSLLPSFSSASSPSHAGDSFQTSRSMVTSGGTDTMEPSTAVFSGSTPRQYSNHSRPHQLKESTSFKTTGPLPLQTEPMEQLSSRSSSTSASALVTASSAGGTFTSSGDHFEKTTLLLTTAAPSLSKDTQHTEMAKASTSILPNTTSQRDVFPAAELTTGKTVTLSTDMTFGPQHSVPTTDHSITTKTRRVQTAATTTLAYVTGVTTKSMETSTATSIKITEENIPATHPSKTSSSSKTTAGFSTTSAAATKPTTVALFSRTRALVTTSHTTVNVCTTNPCLHDGKCVINGVMGKYQCKCSPAWQGEDCSEDVDECLSNPCPDLATCNNTQGSYVCKCPLGYRLEKGKCNLVRTFVDQVALKLNTTHGKYSELPRIEDEIITMLNMSLSTLPGYYNSVVKAARESSSVRVSVQTTFSLTSNVTLLDICRSVQSYISACKTPAETCQFISNLTLLHRVGGLCKQKDPECDRETSECTDQDGIAVCQCKSGYFKYKKIDHSCRACEDGYRLENETCVRCPFGLGGLNCRNPYQLITVVIAAAGGGLLLILGIALIITCCRKNKNDISKLIFKSGDFQMSPYAEYPKNPRAQEWGRETIEMQENGSTKNLLQMTDVYYSPTGLRNAELERNGLYPPYTGLPGSRHSCIYPGQYNLSFISDETRRRDYF
ncbi:protein HEG homolog 1 isoform X5 [Trachemys scripta elegans]|uniref:protein HEG homolog 1 isoform X5 n=1 Tax=Trachemys scripta elegans TaxID=31138 RepID=UPI001552297A|nr:protein HEG homolog 1 isoform X5 [Trachemys scripta elegans]